MKQISNRLCSHAHVHARTRTLLLLLSNEQNGQHVKKRMFFTPAHATKQNLGVRIHPVQENVSDCSALWMFPRVSSIIYVPLKHVEAIKGEPVPSCFLVGGVLNETN